MAMPDQAINIALGLWELPAVLWLAQRAAFFLQAAAAMAQQQQHAQQHEYPQSSMAPDLHNGGGYSCPQTLSYLLQ